jgi:hypothetical protein
MLISLLALSLPAASEVPPLVEGMVFCHVAPRNKLAI